jgi:enoyl-CoA hydratase
MSKLVALSPKGDFEVAWGEADYVIFRLCRPAKHNALTRAILEGLDRTLEAVLARGVPALIVVGEGERAFCAGTDLAETSAMPREAAQAKGAFARDLFVRLSRAPIVSVAALNGLAFGGGLELAMACSFRIAAPHATLSLPEVKLGVLPTYGGTQFLPAIVGRARALDLMLTGRTISSHEAQAIGLVDRVSNAEASLLDQAAELVRSITRWSHVAVQSIQRCVAASGPSVSEAGLEVEAAEAAIVTASADAREGVAAFLEKRPPVFNRPD